MPDARVLRSPVRALASVLQRALAFIDAALEAALVLVSVRQSQTALAVVQATA